MDYAIERAANYEQVPSMQDYLQKCEEWDFSQMIKANKKTPQQG